MSKHPTCAQDVDDIMEELRMLVEYPEQPLPTSDKVAPLDAHMTIEVNQVLMVEKMDINTNLMERQQEWLMDILERHDARFASKRADVGQLKADPSMIRLKEGARPVRDLGFIEKCEGPWAVGALLIPSDVDKGGTHSKIKTRPLRKEPRLRTNRHGVPKMVISDNGSHFTAQS